MTVRPAARGLLHRWGGLMARRPWRVVVTWGVLTVASFAVAIMGVGGEGSLFSRLHTDEPSVAAEATAGADILAASSPRSGATVLLTVDAVDVAHPDTAAAVVAATQRIGRIEHVASVLNPFVVPGGPTPDQAGSLLSQGDPSRGFIVVTTLAPRLTAAQERAAEQQVRQEYAALARALPTARTDTGSTRALLEQVTDQIETDLRTGESIALPLSFIVMVLVFGGFIAAGMPIIGAVASIGGALAILYAYSWRTELDASAVNVVTLLGLALCIDYGLLVVSRCREELRRLSGGRPARALSDAQIELALSRTAATAGRTVLFSGITVAIALSGLLVFEARIIRAIGAAGVSVVLLAMLVAVTLVLALCRVAAHRLLAKGTETAPEDGVFSRLARTVRRAPWVVIVLGTAALVALAVPSLSTRITSSGHELMPVGTSQRDFYDRLGRDYPRLAPPQVTVVIEGSVADAQRYAQQTIRPLRGVSEATSKGLDARYACIEVRVADGATLGADARSVVRAVRADRAGLTTWVTGPAAGLADFTASITQRAPLAIALVVVATFVLLFLMTGSVILPAKALLLNVVSLGASLGVTVWVFQDGHLEGLLGFTSVGALESIIPPLVLAFGFGLSMDYELFLISRIAELYRAGADNDRAVEVGLQRSGRIITCAALLVVIVFAGFMAGQLLVIKQIGLALTVAVLLDATIVRMLLVPATMTVLGHWNWWAPAPLRRLHARFGISE